MQARTVPVLESWRPPPKSNCEAPITEVWGQPPVKFRAEPRGQGGKASLKPKHGFWTFNGSRKFARFFKIWKCKKSGTICVVSAKK